MTERGGFAAHVDSYQTTKYRRIGAELPARNSNILRILC